MRNPSHNSLLLRMDAVGFFQALEEHVGDGGEGVHQALLARPLVVDEADQRDADQEEGQHEEAPPQQRPGPQGPRHGRGRIRAFKKLADRFEVAGDGPSGGCAARAGRTSCFLEWRSKRRRQEAG